MVSPIKSLPQSASDFLLSCVDISEKWYHMFQSMILWKQCSEFDSPIESMFFCAVCTVRHCSVFNGPVDGLVSITNGNKIEGYKVDFLIGENVVVELDGHEFHERTKEQSKSDKKRDRSMTASGFRVIRFTGSEVFNKPFECAIEALTIARPDVEWIDPRSLFDKAEAA